MDDLYSSCCGLGWILPRLPLRTNTLSPLPHQRQPGYTLVEVLVVISVIGTLVALSLPAIQYAREAARRVTCNSHLVQLGLAVLQYETTFKMLPPGSSFGLSMHVSILPYIEQSALYDRIQEQKDNNFNASVPIDVALPVFLCPSDPAPALLGSSQNAGTNYAGNCGVWTPLNGFDGLFAYFPSPPTYRGAPVRIADVTDGMSNTAALSEILRASTSKSRLRVNWNTPKKYVLSTELDAFASYCRSLPDDPWTSGWLGDPWARGVPWTEGAVAFTLYNHGIEPNSPSCYNQADVTSALSSATSEHKGGVNVLFGDGRVEFTADTVDRVLWRDIGSRASGSL